MGQSHRGRILSKCGRLVGNNFKPYFRQFFLPNFLKIYNELPTFLLNIVILGNCHLICSEKDLKEFTKLLDANNLRGPGKKSDRAFQQAIEASRRNINIVKAQKDKIIEFYCQDSDDDEFGSSMFGSLGGLQAMMGGMMGGFDGEGEIEMLRNFMGDSLD